MMYWGNGGWGMMLPMVFGNLLFWGLIIAAIVLLVRTLGSPAAAKGAGFRDSDDAGHGRTGDHP
ncbi:MAG TPA: hypothetical protein VFC00_31855 [Micromonosporaceae bacterium]|nr:hypothetical protein [Micromonosporaceae bacterium]